MMKANTLVAITAILLAVSFGTAHATSFPEAERITPTAGVTINATASVTYGPFDWKYPAVTGAAALDLECISATGDADVQVEVLALSTVNASTPVSCYLDGTNKSIISASTLTDFGAEGEWFLAVPLCASEGYYVKITGVNANPADTLCKAYMLIQ